MNMKIRRQISSYEEEVFLRKHHNVEFELRNYRSYCQPPNVVIKLFAEIFVECEVKPDEDVKAFKSMANVKMYLQA